MAARTDVIMPHGQKRNVTSAARRALRALDSYRRTHLVRRHAPSGALSLRLRNRAHRAGASATAEGSRLPQLWVLAARAIVSTGQAAVDYAWTRGARSLRSAVPALAADQEAVSRPEGAQLPLVRRSRHLGVGAVASRCGRVHHLHRAEPWPQAGGNVARSQKQRRELRAGKSPVGYPAGTGTEQAAPQLILSGGAER